MIRLIVICDACSAVGPHVDAESAERGALSLIAEAQASGWNLQQLGHGCPECSAKWRATLRSIVEATDAA